METGITRRRFLTAIGVVGGAGALTAGLGALDLGGGDSTPFRAPRRSDFALQGRGRGASVLVLGAGVSGLCCAYELEKAGYEVSVVEARSRIGGRNWTVRGGDEVTDLRRVRQQATFAEGRWLNAGPARIAQHHTTLDYCRELGVPVEVFVNANSDGWVVADGSKRRMRAARADIGGYVAEVLTKAVDRERLDREIPHEEATALVDHLRFVGVLGGPDRGYEEVPGAARQSGVINEPEDLLTLLESGFGERMVFDQEWHQAMPMFHPVGGMDAIPRALAAAVTGDVRTSAEVVELEATSSGVVAVVSIDGELERLEADHGICTLPPHLAAELDSPWDAAVVRALATPDPVPTVKIGLEYDRRFWELDDRIFGGTTVTDRDVRVIWYPSTDYLAEGGVLVGAYPFGLEAVRLGRMNHAAREALAVEAGEAIHGPRYREDLVSSFSVDWPTQPFSEGGWAQWRRYGFEYDLLDEPAEGWWFAGDWLSHATGWQHGAFESARRVVARLHERVLAED